MLSLWECRKLRLRRHVQYQSPMSFWDGHTKKVSLVLGKQRSERQVKSNESTTARINRSVFGYVLHASGTKAYPFQISRKLRQNLLRGYTFYFD